MPIRDHDVFRDFTKVPDPSKNAFVARLIHASESGELPIAHGPALQTFAGNWRSKFLKMTIDTSSLPLIVEIGCHSGETLIDMAAAFPEALFVGIDITFKRIVHTAERATDRGLKNVLAILANAGGLSRLFAENEVSGFVTFFPDPWVKKKHAHNRLYAPKFCGTATQLLAPGGFLWLKTDQKQYFEDACVHTADAGFTPVSSIPVMGETDFGSLFLRRFELKGTPWYGQKWVKRPNEALQAKGLTQ